MAIYCLFGHIYALIGCFHGIFAPFDFTLENGLCFIATTSWPTPVYD